MAPSLLRPLVCATGKIHCHTYFLEAFGCDGGAANSEGEEVGPGMGDHKETVVVKPVGVGALLDGRKVEVMEVSAAIGQGPEGL